MTNDQVILDESAQSLLVGYVNFLNKMNSLNKNTSKPVGRKSTRSSSKKARLNELAVPLLNDQIHSSDSLNIVQNGAKELPKITETLLIMSNDILEIKNSVKFILDQQLAKSSNFFPQNPLPPVSLAIDNAIPTLKVSSVPSVSCNSESSIFVERNNFYRQCASIENGNDLISPIQHYSKSKSNLQKKGLSTRTLRGRLRPLRSTNAHYEQIDSKKPKTKTGKRNLNQMKNIKKNYSTIMTRKRQSQLSNSSERNQSRKENVSNNKSTNVQSMDNNAINKSTNNKTSLSNHISMFDHLSDDSSKQNEIMQVNDKNNDSEEFIKPFKVILNKLDRCPICNNVLDLDHRCL